MFFYQVIKSIWNGKILWENELEIAIKIPKLKLKKDASFTFTYINLKVE